MNVALLGTGKMGAVIARQVAAGGFDLTVWNRTLERARALGVGAVAETAAEAAAGAEVVLSILYDPPSVREVYASLAPAPGQVFVEMSTVGPDVAEHLAPWLAGAGAELLVAPILGSLPGLEQRTALILCGGDQAAFERARPVLATFGQPEHVPSRREASGLKLVSNAMLSVSTIAAAELMAAAGRAGLDRDTTFRILCRTVPYLQARARGYLERAHDRPLFELAGIVKDLDLALDLGRDAGAAMPVTGLTRELFAMAEPGHAEEELTAVIETYPQ